MNVEPTKLLFITPVRYVLLPTAHAMTGYNGQGIATQDPARRLAGREDLEARARRSNRHRPRWVPEVGRERRTADSKVKCPRRGSCRIANRSS
jgi:hypothetical protein